MQLTGTQPVLLSAASQRQDGAIVLAPDLKGSAERDRAAGPQAGSRLAPTPRSRGASR
jgi:hypothetical protein